MRTGTVAAATLVVIAAVSGQAFAQNEHAIEPGKVEITPYVSMGSPGASRIGTAITFPVTSSVALEAEVGYRRGEGNIHALSSSLNGLYFTPRLGRLFPYVAGGIGLEEYGSPVVLPGVPGILTRPGLRLTMNAGGGIKVPMSDKLGFRTDARWFKSAGRQGAEHWRVNQGITF
ncbi:MAG: hypothetical protein AB7F99_15245 [Vicinamibacterales bacterium]